MCGIVGIVDYSQNSNTSRKLLNQMTDVIEHRGPDAGEIWQSDNHLCGLGHRRLSIIDLSDAGIQPMSTQDGRFTIVFNGEIYNYKEIQSELIDLGVNFNSSSDTEVLLKGFKHFGKGVIDKLVGMWSFAVWDNVKKELFACRDRIGIKPFYFHYDNNKFVFGSEIKSILKHPEIAPNLNLLELPNYLNYGMSSKKESLFAGIRKLESGSHITLSKNGLEIKKYWTPLSRINKDITFEEAGQKTVELLRQAVKSRMVSDVPFGVFLSGGIDSSLNVALMAELMDRPIDTYTVGFKELEKYNELKYASKVSKIYNTNHNEILIDHDDCKDIIDDITWHTDEPNGDPVCMPLYFLSKLTHESGTTVIQVGEGSDEQFVGYKWMLQGYNLSNSYWKYYQALPKFLRNASYSFAKLFSPIINSELAMEYMRRATAGQEFSWSGVPIFGQYSQSKMRADNRLDETIPYKYAQELFSEIESIKSNAEYFEKIMYIEQQQRLAEILLMRVDKIGMAHHLEARVPFLDHRLVEFTTSLPDKIKVPNKKEPKTLLKKAIEDILQKDIIYRKKMGFAAPVHDWFRGPWKGLANYHLFESSFAKTGIINSDYKNKLIKDLENGNKLGSHVYNLVALSAWYERFID
jgi:asparagine synthase (glutamine-hydrolysing)